MTALPAAEASIETPPDAARGPRVFAFDNTYARELSGTYVAWPPARVPAPKTLYLNRELAHELGADAALLDGDAGAAVLAGNVLPDGAQPIAQAYAGHQFGGFSPQLGDGRALLLGEVVDRHGRRSDIAFKGSGRTPFSRGGDGKAAVGPMLREVLVGEAMHALGIPTTRALAVVATGERVRRERALPGAVLTRVAASHLRVGTFEFFAARGDVERLRRVADYAIARHDPALAGQPQRHLALLRAVAQRQAALVAQWMNVGFIHGVMNTDNTTISGETIDYGPCAFIEAYDPRTVFSSIDHHGRYAFGNQPHIVRWNLARLAEALLPLLADDTERAVALATEVIDAFPAWYRRALLQGQRAKLGLQRSDAELDDADATLAADWLALLQAQRVDFTLAWRRLADAAAGDEAPLRALFAAPQAPDAWLARWRARCALDDGGATSPQAAAARAARLRAVNPLVIPRNHRVEEALAAASDDGDLAPFERLLAALKRPYDDAPELAAYAEPAPAHVTAAYRTFCGT
ncbi:protein adenylyltransferase SelO family protein [Azohydromonas sediminis]|uniref:protein adenylyltransferase SelO family protein n=1 Tax=Azohydromonas sediminis TaxID=2259674 RepID=UPI000E657E23|nr:YdiU family protein [Azohydromonas sediminis]